MEEKFRQTFEASEREHQERVTMTVEEHERKCALYEDQIKECEKLTQSKVEEISQVRLQAEEAAAAAAKKLSLVQATLDDAREQVRTLTDELQAQTKGAKEMDGVAAFGMLHENYSRRTLGRMFRVQRECMYPKAAKDLRR